METALFDGRGHPVAYIVNDDAYSIYLWTGHAVAYIEEENIYGWNGRHLGWFVDGVVYNRQGRKVGSVREKCPYAPNAEFPKYARFAGYTRNARVAPSARPVLRPSYADEPFEVFLKQGAVGVN